MLNRKSEFIILIKQSITPLQNIKDSSDNNILHLILKYNYTLFDDFLEIYFNIFEEGLEKRKNLLNMLE